MRAGRVEIGFPGNHAGFAQGFEHFRAALDAECVEGAARYNAELVFEEIVANIVRHGAVEGRDPHVRVTLDPGPDSLVVSFDDDGLPFDPCGDVETNPPTSLEGDKVGGFGLKLVRAAASSLEYLRTADGHNRLRVSVAR